MTVFTELGRPDLAKISFQYAAEEAEHRLLANYTLDARPANDVAFAPPLFATPKEFYQSLQDRGIIGERARPLRSLVRGRSIGTTSLKRRRTGSR